MECREHAAVVPTGHPRQTAGQSTRESPGRLARVTGLKKDVRTPVGLHPAGGFLYPGTAWTWTAGRPEAWKY